MPIKAIIGVDVGGTNTDAVLIDISRSKSDPVGSILAAHKSPTTADATEGIEAAVRGALEHAHLEHHDDVLTVHIGTTHFVNAVVQRDARKLARVGLLRLCGPYCREIGPFEGLPKELRDVVEGYHACVSGGLEIDGNLIAAIDEAEIRTTAKHLRDAKISSVAVVGVYSSIDTKYRQEEEVLRILQDELGASVGITLSHKVSGIGFLERENATILNAAILPLARKTISSLRRALSNIGLRAPIYLTQNDGTLVSATEAAQLPILTYLSGPINSLTGAAFLAGKIFEEDVLVVDIGGTTTDVCALQPSGFPRPAAAFSTISGARTNFPIPDICSIGLGGGSIVRNSGAGVTVGPDSVGHNLLTEAVAVGGKTLTTSDILIKQGKLVLGHPHLVEDLDPETVKSASLQIKKLLEKIVDMMKTAAGPVQIILVGGGSVLAPDTLQGVSNTIRLRFSDVANAVGAAMAKVSGSVDVVRILGTLSEKDAVEEVCKEAILVAISKGAENPKIVERAILPVPYGAAGSIRIIARAVGILNPEKLIKEDSLQDPPHGDGFQAESLGNAILGLEIDSDKKEDEDYSLYKPQIDGKLWKLSMTDLEFIHKGCGILGCGGGGDPYASFLSVSALVSAGAAINIIDSQDMEDYGIIPSVGFMGSPSTMSERLPSGSELQKSVLAVLQTQGKSREELSAVMSVEIGGSNGFRGIQAAAWVGKPVVDADLMGRAYPNLWQVTPNNAGISLAPAAISDAQGNTFVQTTAASNRDVENFMRPLCVAMGQAGGVALSLLSGHQTKNHAAQRSISLAWRLGRALDIAKQAKLDVIQALLSTYPGKHLFSGKVTRVERNVVAGFTIGSLHVSPSTDDTLEDETDATEEEEVKQSLRIEFQNENIRAVLGDDETTATVPDLITVLDQENGTAIGTPDYRYGLRVHVVAFVGSPQWTEGVGLENGGPKAFGLEDVYKPSAVFREVRSVIEEFMAR